MDGDGIGRDNVSVDDGWERDPTVRLECPFFAGVWAWLWSIDSQCLDDYGQLGETYRGTRISPPRSTAIQEHRR